MSELAQELIKSRAQSNSWSLQSYPGKVKLPSDILRALPSPDAANKILKTTYLPEETQTWLAELKSKAGSTAKEKRRTEPKEPREPKERKTIAKRKGSTKTNGSAKRSRPAKKWNSDDSDETEDASNAEPSDIEGDVEVALSATSSDEGDTGISPREKLGRSARTRANIRKQTKKTKSKSNPPSSDV
ncbi:hypothetical protein PILCRDRAFT_341662 [Piloderma croceum F 1598]|uniref:Uncharacterized protein n=1 Tax=Piloderma croceum (strain F 1598) TaxID=765440 RepID=A0A0C3G4Z1_PILCF|nr:hypothetical protein PILCRDRAFT_341662 [Piloderma croceum F 1598]